MESLIKLSSRLFPSEPSLGQIGSIELNIWLAQISGLPLVGLKNESKNLRMALIFYGLIFTTLITFLYTAFEIYDLILCWPDLDTLTQNACLSLTHLSGLIKTINTFYRYEDVRRVIEDIKWATKKYVVSKNQRKTFLRGEFENKIPLLIYILLVGFTGFLSFAMLLYNAWNKVRSNVQTRFLRSTSAAELKMILYIAPLLCLVPPRNETLTSSSAICLGICPCGELSNQCSKFWAWIHAIEQVALLNESVLLLKKRIMRNLTTVLTGYCAIGQFAGKLTLFNRYNYRSCEDPQDIAGKTFPYRIILPSWLPYSLQLIYMGAGVFILAMQVISTDYLNMNLINQIRFQLKILNLTFDDLIIDVADKSLRVRKHVQIGKKRLSANERLETIIEHHCLLRRLRADVESIFQFPILVQFFTSLIIFAMTGFQATVRADGSSRAILIYFYCGCIFCELFLYCWFGNDVFEQSKTLSVSGYNSSWYQFDQKFKTSLLIFLSNAQRPFVFTAGGFISLSLPSFTSILSKAYTYIAVLKQLYSGR